MTIRNVVLGGLLTAGLMGTIAAVALATSGPLQDLVGIWQHPDNGSQIELYACGGDLCGKIHKITDGQSKDTNNPEPEKRDRPIVGLVIISKARLTGPATWSGKLYNRADGQSYDGHITLKSPSLLELQGCAMLVMCRTVTWSRAPRGK